MVFFSGLCWKMCSVYNQSFLFDPTRSNSIQKWDIVLSTFCSHCFGSSEFLSRCNILKTVDIKLVARNTTFKESNLTTRLTLRGSIVRSTVTSRPFGISSILKKCLTLRSCSTSKPLNPQKAKGYHQKNDVQCPYLSFDA